MLGPVGRGMCDDTRRITFVLTISCGCGCRRRKSTKVWVGGSDGRWVGARDVCTTTDPTAASRSGPLWSLGLDVPVAQ